MRRSTRRPPAVVVGGNRAGGPIWMAGPTIRSAVAAQRLRSCRSGVAAAARANIWPTRTVAPHRSPGTCVDNAGNVSPPFPYGLQVRRLGSGGSLRAARAGADVNSWYNHSVAVAFTGNDPMSGIESCTTTTYEGPDSKSASVPGVCRDRAGNVERHPRCRVQLRLDSTGCDFRECCARARPQRLVQPPCRASRSAAATSTSGVEACARTPPTPGPTTRARLPARARAPTGPAT